MNTSRMLVQRLYKCGQDIVFKFKIDCSNGSVFLLLYLFPPHTPSLFALIALPCCCGSPRFSLKTHSERQDAVFFKHVSLIRFFWVQLYTSLICFLLLALIRSSITHLAGNVFGHGATQRTRALTLVCCFGLFLKSISVIGLWLYKIGMLFWEIR